MRLLPGWVTIWGKKTLCCTLAPLIVINHPHTSMAIYCGLSFTLSQLDSRVSLGKLLQFPPLSKMTHVGMETSSTWTAYNDSFKLMWNQLDNILFFHYYYRTLIENIPDFNHMTVFKFHKGSLKVSSVFKVIFQFDNFPFTRMSSEAESDRLFHPCTSEVNNCPTYSHSNQSFKHNHKVPVIITNTHRNTS